MALLELLAITALGSVLGLLGGLFLLLREKFFRRITLFLVSFAAGSLIGVTFLDLLPEAVTHEIPQGFVFTILAIALFFILEKFFILHHHHTHEEEHPLIYLVNVGDAIHNFIDGVIIATTFLVDAKLGLITALAIFAHEVPQEIGDFGVLMHFGIKRRKIILYNVLSAMAAFVGALGIYFFSDVQKIFPAVLFFAAGSFIYIANSDLIPELHREFRLKKALTHVAIFILGILTIWFLGIIFPE
jgi:zinc and cadmium transporter